MARLRQKLDTPGITRDRLYAETDWIGRRFTVVDTGGIHFSESDPLAEQIRVQAGIAHARELGAEAQAAMGVLGSSDSTDVEGLMLATRKADAAFRMLDAVRMAMNEAYAQARDRVR